MTTTSDLYAKYQIKTRYGTTSCPDCGQIIRLKNTKDYCVKLNKSRNRYYCIRCSDKQNYTFK